MIGISHIGIYVPLLKYERQKWAIEWQQPSLKKLLIGERRVCDYDEDALTMAYGAGWRVKKRLDKKQIDALYLASTTLPYAEMGNVNILAFSLDLKDGIFCMETGGSLRCAGRALLSAVFAIKSGQFNRVLVVATDMRAVEPGHYLETMRGDCAASVVLDTDEVALEYIDYCSINQPFSHPFRLSNRPFIQFADEKYFAKQKYLKTIPLALRSLCKKTGLDEKKIKKLIVYAPEGASYMALAKRLSNPFSLNPEPLLMNLGDAGSASVFAQLHSAILDVNPGDYVAMVFFGDGVDAVLFRATEYIDGLKRECDLGWMSSGVEIPSIVEIYRARRRFSDQKEDWSFRAFTSPTIIHKMSEDSLKLIGRFCRRCNIRYYPSDVACPQCGGFEDTTKVSLNREGRLFSFTEDYIFPAPVSPVCMGIVDLDGGGRLLLQMIRQDISLDIDKKIGLDLRLYHRSSGINHYFYKARIIE